MLYDVFFFGTARNIDPHSSEIIDGMLMLIEGKIIEGNKRGGRTDRRRSRGMRAGASAFKSGALVKNAGSIEDSECRRIVCEDVITGKEAIAAIVPSQNDFRPFCTCQCPSKLFPSPKAANQ